MRRLMGGAFWSLLGILLSSVSLFAQEPGGHTPGGEANLVLPDLGNAEFLGINGETWLLGGIGICVLGLLFGLMIMKRLKDMPVHRSMLEVSDLIFETCKTYLLQQGKFILILEAWPISSYQWSVRTDSPVRSARRPTRMAFDCVSIRMDWMW